MAGSMDRLEGTVKWFDNRRGFGFITPEGGGEDLFVHQSSIMAVGFRSLTAGETVEFAVCLGSDGRSSAVGVTGSRGYSIHFRDACILCDEVGHIGRDCKKSNDSMGGVGSYHIGRGSPAAQPTITLEPLKDETPLGQISKGVNSEDEDEEQSEGKIGSEWRNWAGLPRDTLSIIFKKIAAAEVLSSAQSVCRPWRELSHEVMLWRCVDLRYDPMRWGSNDMVSMTMMAVDRSKGCMEELHMHEVTDELMHYIAERATRLRGLHLTSGSIGEETLVETLRKLSLLEELQVTYCCSFSYKMFGQVGQACPQLKSFRFDEQIFGPTLSDDFDDDENIGALAIAKHFKQLRRLQLFADRLTNSGLLAILDNCPHLEHLDIRDCFDVDFDENLKNKCSGIKHLRLPYDSNITDYTDY